MAMTVKKVTAGMFIRHIAVLARLATIDFALSSWAEWIDSLANDSTSLRMTA
jgi:hypothetical protein